jgi:CBS domain-containing protein
MENPIHQFVHSKAVADVAPKRGMTCVSSSDTVEQAIKKMTEANVLSAPVMEGSSVLGLVDALDILYFILSIVPEDNMVAEEIDRASRAAAFKSVKDVMDFSGRDPYVPLYHSSPASEAVQFFTMGVHRVTVVDESGAPEGTVSQSDINRLAAANLHMGKLKPVGERSIKSLVMGQGGCIAVAPSSTVVEALKKLKSEGVSALAVVDGQDKLVGNLSARDFFAMFKRSFQDLTLPVLEYLQQASPGSLRPTSVTEDDTLLHVSKKLAEGLHHVWVATNGEAKGVVTLTDMMSIFNTAEIPL